MANLGTITLHDLTGLVVEVRLSYPLKARLWLMLQLLRLAMWVGGGCTEVERMADG
ncbi:hypothetical protein LCGC14_0386870 [marine sediment metagenome]|uniref:Transposase DDE domain-containing protein n=1 Tax=marine sediment metagenome TaxID=412755 RepID=A0A0F9T6H9_9ZZZZ